MTLTELAKNILNANALNSEQLEETFEAYRPFFDREEDMHKLDDEVKQTAKENGISTVEAFGAKERFEWSYNRFREEKEHEQKKSESPASGDIPTLEESAQTTPGVSTVETPEQPNLASQNAESAFQTCHTEGNDDPGEMAYYGDLQAEYASEHDETVNEGELNHLNHLNQTSPNENKKNQESVSDAETGKTTRTYLTKDGKLIEFQPFKSMYTTDTGNLKPFPVEALPEVLRRYAIETAESVQVSPDMVAVPLLGVLALCCMGKFQVCPKPDHVEPVCLYITVVARPSERKSPVLKEVLSPVRDFVKEWNADEKNQKEVSNYNHRLKRAKSEYQEVVDKLCGKNKKRKKEEELNEIDEESLVAEAYKLEKAVKELESNPVLPLKLLLDDCTPEALVEELGMMEGEKAGIFSAEGGFFDILAGRYSDKVDMDPILKAYNGETYSCSRVTRKGEELEHPLLTLMFMVQPVVLQSIMMNDVLRGKGFLARILYSIPASRVGTRKYRSAPPVSDRAKADYKELVHKLLEIPMVVLRDIKLSEEAMELADAWFDMIEDKLPKEEKDGGYAEIEEWAGKIFGTTLRIAALFSITKNISGEYIAPISGETMQEAIQVGAYFIEEAKVAFKMMGFGDSQAVRDARYIIQRISEKFNGWTDLNDLNDLIQLTPISKEDLYGWCQKQSLKKEAMERALEVLVQNGYIAVLKKETGKKGRPSEAIYINPEYIKRKTSQQEP